MKLTGRFHWVMGIFLIMVLFLDKEGSNPIVFFLFALWTFCCIMVFGGKKDDKKD